MNTWTFNLYFFLPIDCGSCDQCLKMKKFTGDTNDELLICDRRQCDYSEVVKIVLPHELSPRKREKYTKILFLSEDKVDIQGEVSYYRRAQINDESYRIGDFAEVYPEDSESPSYICKIIAIIKEKSTKAAHVRWLERGKNTIFG